MLAGCGGGSELLAADAVEPSMPIAEESTQEMLGGCILTTPIGVTPVDLHTRTALTATDAYPPFNRVLTAAGLTLVGDNDISDPFMELVATTIEEIFPHDEGEWTLTAPADLQANMPELWAMYERTAGRVMVAPSLETLLAIGPTRAEEAE